MTVRTLSTSRVVDAPVEVVWDLLVDVRRWPEWGPSVRSAVVDGRAHRITDGATGTVTTAVGIRVPFAITEFVDQERWSWNVLGLPATGHVVRRLGPRRSEVGFEVPWPAAPYLAVCRLALSRIADMATDAPS